MDKIFQSNGFKYTEELRSKEEAGVNQNAVLKRIYVNEYDEMYFIVEGMLDMNILDEIIGICSNAEGNGKFRKVINRTGF